MSSPFISDIRPGRLGAGDYALNFANASPCLTPAQALLEAERCRYCFDAPCMTACPTAIDMPSFIRRIADGNVRGAARTILESNPLGGMCARVCPTETLCEQACVRTAQRARPVAIGRLQRHAVDALMDSSRPQLFTRAPLSGRKVAVVGAGPAGLACAHTLALRGHDAVVFDARPKAGGLNEYGLAAYKTPDNFAQRELQWLLAIGGVEIRSGWKLDTLARLDELRRDYSAVFLGMGLAATHKLGVPGETESIAADMVLKAIGQTLGNPVLAQAGLALESGRIATSADGATSLAGVWAGGDCRAGGLGLTVEAVAHGKRAAEAIHAHFSR